MMKIQFNNFKFRDTKLDTVLNLLLLSVIFLTFTTFLSVIYKTSFSIGSLNIYGENELAPLLLISLLFEISALINRNEKLFIPLRIVNSFLLFLILSSASNLVARTGIDSSEINSVGNFASEMMSEASYGFYNMPQDLAQPDRLLFGYSIISISLLLCLIIFAVYLYYRFYKKEKFIQTSYIQYRDFIDSFTKNKLLSIGIYFLLASQFLPFNRMQVNLLPTPAFAHMPIISLAICIIGFLLIYSILHDQNNINRYIIIELLSIVFWNPFTVFKYGAPGIGYWLYIVGLAFLAYSILGDKLRENS
jgi:hypothetical protein